MRVWSLGREDPLEDGMAIHSRLENPMNKGAWQATVPGGAKSQTRLKWLSMHVGMHLPLKNVSAGKLWSSPLAVTVGDGWARGPLLEGPLGLCLSLPPAPLLSPGNAEGKSVNCFLCLGPHSFLSVTMLHPASLTSYLRNTSLQLPPPPVSQERVWGLLLKKKCQP